MKNNGYFGIFGGSFVDEGLKKELDYIASAYNTLKKDKAFIAELNDLRRDYQGRPTPLYFAKKLTEKVGGANIYLKREDLNHTGAHKINHCLGEALLAKYLGKRLVIGETGAGQHGLALATACALVGLECHIHMGSVDIQKQLPNVLKMKLLGAKVIPTDKGTATLKDAVDSAFAEYTSDYKNSIYCIGSVVGPHPYPTIVRDFQSVVGKELKKQSKQKNIHVDAIIACVGGGSNAMGVFYPYLKELSTELIGVEPLGRGKGLGDNAASLTFGKVGILHGFKTLALMDENNEVVDAYSVASGLDYPGSGPEHCYLKQIGRARYELISDVEAIDAFYALTRLEGIVPAVESSHAVAFAMKYATALGKGKNIVVNLSGRGDKDCAFILEKYNRIEE